MIMIILSACQRGIIRSAGAVSAYWFKETHCWLLLHASPCFDIAAPLKETNLSLRLRVKIDVLRVTAQTRSPVVPEKLAGTGSRSPPPFPSLHPFFWRWHYSTVGLLEIPSPPPAPAIVERQPSLPLSSHICETCNSAQNKYKMHLNLSGICKMTSGQLGGRRHFDRKNVSPLTARDTSAWVYRQYFSAWAVKLNRTMFCYLDKVDTA